MPTYRVYYAERGPTEDDQRLFYGLRGGLAGVQSEGYKSTEWEEEVEAADAARALDSFFREHVRDNSQLMWVDDAGESHPVEGLAYDPEKTYIWIEDGKMMESQGLDETTPGMVTCPLCGGEGEVEESIADEYLAEDEEEGEDEVNWG